MKNLMERWTDFMRRERYEDAWALSALALTARDPSTRDDPSLPYHQRWVWDGRPFRGRDVLVRCYHGLGDTIQFARFLPLLAEQAASVTLEVQPSLVPLLEGMAGISRLIPFDPARPAPPSSCDIEITELPFALRSTPAAARAPYLHAEGAALPPGTIGLCYSGGDWDRERSLPPGLLLDLCRGHPCLTLVPEPLAAPVINPEGCPMDIAQTAAMVASCAVVISVDTMIAHLAGALGRPTWLLLKAKPDWRWKTGSARTPWYPSMRLFHQQAPGDWRPVLQQVEHALQSLDLASKEPPVTSIPPAPPPSSPQIPVAWGELLDKIAILEIKQERIQDVAARSNVARELGELWRIGARALEHDGIAQPFAALKAVNIALWEIEDAIRQEEARGTFGPEFIQLARAVYQQNDRRAGLKREISRLLASELVEEKSYWTTPAAGIIPGVASSPEFSALPGAASLPGAPSPPETGAALPGMAPEEPSPFPTNIYTR